MSIKQGDLDGLCGVYSIVNAFNNLFHLDQKEQENLFNHLIFVLEEEKRAAGAIVGGTCRWEIDLLVNAAIEYVKINHDKTVILEFPFKSNGRIGIETYWQRMIDFFNSHEKTAAVVGMAGKYDHWTCVKRFTKKTMITDDSMGIRHIRKSSCRMEKNYNKKLYNFVPTQTWCLYLV